MVVFISFTFNLITYIFGFKYTMFLFLFLFASLSLLSFSTIIFTLFPSTISLLVIYFYHFVSGYVLEILLSIELCPPVKFLC